MPPQVRESLLPGVRGKDYRFVSYGGAIYVVYSVRLPGGRQVLMSWRVNKSDYKAYGVDAGKATSIGRAQFKRLNFFGNATEVIGGDPGEHPFQKYLRRLQEINGHVSWMSDREVMGIMLSGFLEGWSDQEMLSAVENTRWYQSRTEAQRDWELNKTKAERKTTLETWTSRMDEALRELYGPNVDLPKDRDLKTDVMKIASGKFGDPSEGFELWLAQERKKAEKIEGTTAWIERQQTIEDQRAFMNRPEDMFEQLRQDSLAWLGPAGVPDSTVLRDWAERLVSGESSDADWQQFVQGQAKALYPWLGPQERWQDRASSYKRMAEDVWGTPIGWDDPILSNLGGVGPQGAPTGAAMTYDEFNKLARSKAQFWQGPVAREEGFGLFNLLNSVFQGVTT